MSQAFGLSDAVQYALLTERSPRQRALQVLYHVRQLGRCTIL